jgi:3-hydroxyacyl-CoA dehydrogenase
MHYANSLGLDKVLERLNHYHQTTGDDFWIPSQYLVDLAESGQSF